MAYSDSWEFDPPSLTPSRVSGDQLRWYLGSDQPSVGDRGSVREYTIACWVLSVIAVVGAFNAIRPLEPNDDVIGAVVAVVAGSLAIWIGRVSRRRRQFLEAVARTSGETHDEAPERDEMDESVGRIGLTRLVGYRQRLTPVVSTVAVAELTVVAATADQLLTRLARRLLAFDVAIVSEGNTAYAVADYLRTSRTLAAGLGALDDLVVATEAAAGSTSGDGLRQVQRATDALRRFEIQVIDVDKLNGRALSGR